MKLLSKINRYFLGAALLVFLLGIAAMYISIHWAINAETEERLHALRDEVVSKLQTFDSIPSTILAFGDLVEVEPLPEGKSINTREVDTNMYNSYEKEVVPYHQLIFATTLHGQPYKVTISKSHIEEDDILETVAWVISGLFFILLLTLALLNRWIFSRTWQPFYHTLQTLSHFNLNQRDPVNLKESAIDEFSGLNNIVMRMTRKMQSDYRNVKEFTENAAHEIKTPLAIIRNQLELLLQSDELTEDQIHRLQSISQAVERLNSLSKTLLLLSKIENRQFVESEPIDLKERIEETLDMYEELIVLRKLTVTRDKLESVKQIMNPILADSLISNLLYNSIVHNQQGGSIHLELTPEQLRISNTGEAPEKDLDEYFKRFVKGKDGTASHGLGLAIVKQICETYGFTVHYTWEDQMHTLTVNF